MQYAVDAEADAIVLFVRFEMDVRGAVVDRVEHHLLDEAHHRRVVDVGCRCVVRLAGLVFVEEVEVDVVGGQPPERFLGRLGILGDEWRQLGLLDDDRIDAEPGLEANLVECTQVGGVGDGDREAVAALIERDDLVRRDQLAVDGIDRNMRLVESRDVEQRIAEGVGDETRDVQRGHLLAGDDLFDQRLLFMAGVGLQLLRLSLLEAAGLHERACESAEGGCLGGCRHGIDQMPFRLKDDAT